MKTFLLIATTLVISAINIIFFFRGFDLAIETDNLKSQIQLQRKELNFLQSITNSAFANCKMTVEAFEFTARSNGRDVLWQGNDSLVGPFRIKRKESCIISIEAVAGL